MKKLILTLFLVLASVSQSMAITLKSATSNNMAVVDKNGSVAVSDGRATRATYIAVAGLQVTTAGFSIALEAPASHNVYVTQVCSSGSTSTASAAVAVTIWRELTVSSGGTLMTVDASTDSVSKLDPADASYSGVVRLTGSPGTFGAKLDQWGYASGNTGATGVVPMCRKYGENGTKPIVISAGVTNGLYVSVSSHGAGGLSSGSIAIYFYTESAN